MNILQTIRDFTTKSGGTSTCTYDLLKTMNSRVPQYTKDDMYVDLLTPQTLDKDDHLMGDDKWIKVVDNDYRTPYFYSKNIHNWLIKSDYDVYHTNGLWAYVNHATCAIARKKNVPYIITPHGMLYRDAIRRSYWKKWIMSHMHFNYDIAHADCIHATCRKEMEEIRAFGYKGIVAIIPNPCVIPEYADEEFAKKCNLFLGCNLPKNFGFLGRLHPRKKIENLLYGFHELLSGDMSVSPASQLIIMGKGDDAYELFLRSEVQRLGLADRVKFLGFVSGREKYEALAGLAALFVPSDFENFGMIVTEALSVGTPVMASLGTPWEELNSEKCGWWVDRSADSVSKVMRDVLAMPMQELLDMGERGRRLVSEKYSADRVAQQMSSLYRWIIQENMDMSKMPQFVYIQN